MNVILKEVIWEDIEWIRQLRNSYDVRNASLNKKIITKDQNENFWRKNLGREGFDAWVITTNNKQVGVIKIEDKRITISLDKKYRNQGIGYIALKSLNLKGCRAEVMKRNNASIALFSKLGFKDNKWRLFTKD